MAERVKLLIIDDEPAIRRLLATSLTPHGYDVVEAESGTEGLRRVAQDKPDMVLLDLGLPDADGVELIPQIRALSDAPIVVLSVRNDDAAKVAALDRGASDYVAKPFSLPELMARLRAAARHQAVRSRQEPVFELHDLRVDLGRRIVTVRGAPVHLTRREYDCLRLFITHAGKVLTHGYLLREIWGERHTNKVQYLRSYMRMLRLKLETDPSRPKIFLTEPGVGYRLNALD
ncbi:MAG TPA: response regulator [Candidatus Sulfotelmatobacter sp.]|nr:response regulator [Candidatus Sulfotelmatobacter sp.]